MLLLGNVGQLELDMTVQLILPVGLQKRSMFFSSTNNNKKKSGCMAPRLLKNTLRTLLLRQSKLLASKLYILSSRTENGYGSGVHYFDSLLAKEGNRLKMVN